MELSYDIYNQINSRQIKGKETETVAISVLTQVVLCRSLHPNSLLQTTVVNLIRPKWPDYDDIYLFTILWVYECGFL